MERWMESWKQIELTSIKALYGEWYTKYSEAAKKVYDDRTVYCNLYKMMVRAVESMPEEPDNYVAIAVGNKLDEDRKTLQEIVEVFEKLENPTWQKPSWFN